MARFLRTNSVLYAICLVAFIAAAIPISLPLAIGEAAAAVLVYFIGRWRRGAAQQQLTQYMERVSGGRDSAASSNLLFAPLPMMVFDLDTEAVLWSNDSFLQLSGLTDKLYESHLDDVIPDFDTHWLLEGKRESPELVTWNHRQYRVFGGLGRHEELPGSRSVLATTYWMDVTEFEQMRQTVELTRPVMAIVMIDNYEDLMKACPENKRSALLAALEEKLDRWTADTGGLLLGYDLSLIHI